MMRHLLSWLSHFAYVALWAGVATLVYRGNVTLPFPALIAVATAWFYLHREGEQVLKERESLLRNWAPWWDHLGDVVAPTVAAALVWWWTA